MTVELVPRTILDALDLGPLAIAELVADFVGTADPAAVVDLRHQLVDLDARLSRVDRAHLLESRRTARVTEWHMARQWPANADGVNRTDDRPPLGASNGSDRVAWQAVYTVGRADIDTLLTETDADRLTQAAVIRAVEAGGDASGDEWYTPRWIFDALGLRFDLDVCAPIDRSHVATPAERFYTVADDGLTQPWRGLVWCNPPYSAPTPWAERMITHGSGVLLSHVPINGLWFLHVWNACDRLRLFQGVEFVRPSGAVQRPGYWLTLAAFGAVAAEALETMDERIPTTIAERFRPTSVVAT